jgi:hypothetical protein
MGMIFNFKSIANNAKFAYRWNSEDFDVRATEYRLHDSLKMFETYGDGMTQHSPEYYVQKEHLVDCLYSLAAYLLSNEEAAQTVYFRMKLPGSVTQAEVKFFMGLKYNAERIEYYNPQDRKVSKNEKYRHDKRWFEVQSWADGTLKNVYRLMLSHNGYSSGLLDRIAVLIGIRKAMYQLTGDYPWIDVEDYGFLDEKADYNTVETVYEAVVSVIEAHHKLKWVADCVSNYSGRIEEAKQSPVEVSQAKEE